MTLRLPHSQAAVRRIIALSALILAVVLAGGVGLLAYSAIAVDRIHLVEQQDLVRRRIATSLEQLDQDVITASLWDEAYRNLRPRVDLIWADTAVGQYYAGLHHDYSLVLDGHNAPVYGWEAGRRAGSRRQAALAHDAAPLIARVRQRERTNGSLTGARAYDSHDAEQSATGVVVSQGGYYMVAVALVVPQRSNVLRPGPVPLIVSARRIDGPFLTSLASELRVRNPTIGPRPVAASIPVMDVNGVTAAHLAWTPARPGLSVIRQAAPLFGVALLVLLAAGLALAARIRGILRELAAGDRALDRTMAELVRARDAADAANLAKSQFLANMSHEIRTPLNGILGMAQVMEREDLSPVQHDRLKVIRQSGKTLLAVLNDVLDLSKIEAGRLDIDNHEFDLAEAVDAACAAFFNLAAQKDIELRLDIDAGAEGIWWGDGARLRQVLVNLVSNAVKFTIEGHVVIHATPAGAGLRFTVSDSGIGVPADRLGDLFQKFNQVDASTTRRFGGTGLGLAISRQLVELMGGQLSVESIENEGSTFSFDLPLEKRAGRRPSASAAEPDAGRIGPTGRILAAEDNPTNQLILRSLLEPLGVDLVMVGDGREAVEAFRAGGFDLILMDIQMPEMNGLDATTEIRAAEAEAGLGSIPILALSANVMSHQVKAYLAAGMTGFIPKPIEAAKLFVAISEALADARHAEARANAA